MLLIDFPLFMASTMTISSFYLVSQKELFPRTWYKTFLYLPFLMSLGIGLTITNTNAVLEASSASRAPSSARPNTASRSKGEKSQGARNIASASASFPGSSCSSAATSLVCIWYAVSTENYFTVPFLLLFVLGYWYTGLL